MTECFSNKVLIYSYHYSSKEFVKTDFAPKQIGGEVNKLQGNWGAVTEPSESENLCNFYLE